MAQKLKKNLEAAQNFLAGLQTLAIFQEMRLKQVIYGFGGSNFKSSSAVHIRCGQPLEPFGGGSLGMSGTAFERSFGREGQMERFRWSKLGI